MDTAVGCRSAGAFSRRSWPIAESDGWARSCGADLRQQAWGWALTNRGEDGTLPKVLPSGALVSRITSLGRRRTRSNNPDWTRDELILAPGIYLRRRGHIPSPRNAEILKLSDLLNRQRAGLEVPAPCGPAGPGPWPGC